MGTPLELPYPLPAKSTKFDLVRRQQNSPVGSGFIQVINRAMPFWAGEWESPPLQELKRGQLEAILEEIEMGTGTFYGFDPRRPKPYAYRGAAYGTKPWGPTARVTAISYANSTISCDQFVAGAQFYPGDYFSYKQGNIWWLFKAIEQKAADGSGIITIKVKPRPVLSIAAPIELRMERAGCEMKMLLPKDAPGDVDQGTQIKWSGVQFIDRAT